MAPGLHEADPAELADEAPEERRQRAVESLGLGEHASLPQLDRITRLARTLFDVPMSSVTVIDEDRAWFPSSQGMPVPEAPRDETFCDVTTMEGDTTLVRDASADPRFSSLPAVTAHGIRFYAGQPLRDVVGNVVGTFCLYDTRQRDLTAEQLTTFRDLAAWAEHELVSANEMSQAGRVQASLLPARAVRLPGWEVDGMCLPALAVGGDFYDFGVSNGVVHLGLGDVMGKGTGAALVGAGVRAAIRGTHAAVTAGVDLGVTTTQVARSLIPDLERAESFVTLFEAAVDLDDGHVRFVDAGSGLALVVRRDGSVERLQGTDRPFGILPDDHWTEHETHLAPGDRMLVFSDGVLDLLEDPIEWAPVVGALVAEADDLSGLLGRVTAVARSRTPLDDITVLGVFRTASAEDTT